MRSFIKAHRRNESLTSDISDEAPSKTTPTTSPVMHSTPYHTPKQNASPTLSSPKKLLTPIKNLFSSGHSRSSVSVATMDSLGLAVGTPKKPSHRTHTKASQLISNISDLQALFRAPSLDLYRSQDEGSGEGPVLLPQRKQLLSLSPSLVNMTKPYLTVATHQLGLHGSLLLGFASLLSPATVGHGPRSAYMFDSPTISEDHAVKYLKEGSESTKSDHEGAKNVSDGAKSGPESAKTPPPRNKLVSFRAQPDLAQELVSVSEDDEDVNSDTSSQFSFIQDRKGGRNTSVKYYKKVKPQSDVAQTNTFNERDLGYEVDEFSDYDFENNGLDDDDAFDDNDFENSNLFDDDNDNDYLHADGAPDDASFGHGDSRELFQELNALAEQKNAESEQKKDERLPHPFGGELQKEGPLGAPEVSNLATALPVTPSANSVYSFPREETGSSRADGMGLGSSDGDIVLLPTTEEDFNFHTDASRQASQHHLPEDALKNYRKYNKSYHLLIQGPVSPDEGFSDDNGSVNEDDILENYFEFSKLPSAVHSASSVDAGGKTPELSTAEQLQLYDLNLPIINGLTIGQNLRHRMRPLEERNRPHEADSAQNKVFIHRNVAKSSDGTGWRPRRSEQEVFKMRAVKSFHSSLSEDLEAKICKTLAEFDDFTFTNKTLPFAGEEDESTDSNATATGLGIISGTESSNPENRSISSKSTAATNTNRLSIHEMMNLLGSLESTISAQSSEAPKLEEASEVKRKSVLGIMSLLANIEARESSVEGKKEPDQEKRKSVVDMMSSLATIEANLGGPEEKNKRNSISNMMATLAKLDEENSQSASPELKPEDDTQKLISSTSIKDPIARLKVGSSDDVKRYSWSNNDETIAFKTAEGADKVTVTGDDGHENFNFDDVLDEINQMPEDFDFEEQDYGKKSLPTREGFYRSNSYNKQPKKAVIDNKFATNKIETLNKTVTFYRSNSSGQSSILSKSGSISRAPSTRSITSFTSVNEEAEAEDEDSLVEQQEITPQTEKVVESGYPVRMLSPYHDKGSDFKTAVNLGTIKEANSPFLR